MKGWHPSLRRWPHSLSEPTLSEVSLRHVCGGRQANDYRGPEGMGKLAAREARGWRQLRHKEVQKIAREQAGALRKGEMRERDRKGSS